MGTPVQAGSYRPDRGCRDAPGQSHMVNDNDGTAVEAIHNIRRLFPDDIIVFANGGDRTKENIPEMVFNDVEFVFGVGGIEKINSSSDILKNWKQQ